MTLPSGGNNPPISLADINTEFGLGNNLGAYRGIRWYLDNNDRGNFSSGPISITEFYSKRKTSPVVAGSKSQSSGSSITLPTMFNTLTVVCYGGGGGGGGGCYLKAYDEGYGGGAGSSGGTTSFYSGTSYSVSAVGGGGGGGAGVTVINAVNNVVQNGAGSTGAVGSGGGGGSGGNGGSGTGSYTNGRTDIYKLTQGGATGGTGGRGGSSSRVVMNIETMGFNSIKLFYGSNIPISIGGGGGGGAAGNQGGTYATGGSAGNPGSITISWT